jgi:sugar O-acyltransferase (sialic acid O-acetyltransferase NeuD family)
MKSVVLFGNGRVARLAHFYLTHDSEREVAAFTVDRDHVTDDTLFGLPVVPADEVQVRFPPDDFDMFVAMGYGRVNKFREGKYFQAKEMGYELISVVSSKATVWPGTAIGDNCFIMENVVIQPFTTIGNDVTMWAGSIVGHESVIKDHCFVAAHVVIAGGVTVEPNCFIGINATIRDDITIARECVIGAGAVIMKSTREREVLTGAPAKLLAFSSDRLLRI